MTRKIIVTVAPTSVEADSRTLKQTVSVTRFGYISILVEGGESDLKDLAPPFELISMGVNAPRTSPAASDANSPQEVAPPKALPTEALAPSFEPISKEVNTPKISPATSNTNPPQRQEAAPPKALSHMMRLESLAAKVLPAWLKKPLRLVLRLARKIKSIVQRALRRALRFALRLARKAKSTAQLALRRALRLMNLRIIRYFSTYLHRFVIPPLKLLPKASLYYLHAPYQFPAVYLLCKRYGVPFIYDAHDFYAEDREREAQDAFTRRIVYPFYRYLEACCIRRASAVVTVSEGVAEVLHREFGRRPIVIRNCHDTRLDREPSQTLREKLGLSKNEFLLIAVGNAKKGTAILEMLDALTMLPPSVHLAFLGNRYEEYLEAICSRSLEARVHLVPPVKPYEVVPFIRSADVAIILYYPRSYNYLNSLPNRFFQPIAAELPLLYPNLPEIKRIAAQYEIGIEIDPRVPESISNAVIKLMTDPEQLNTYKRNLRKARQELSWEKEEVILRDLISQVLQENSELKESRWPKAFLHLLGRREN